MERLRDFFGQSGEPVPDEIILKHPIVPVDLPPDDFSRRVVEILRGRFLLFRRGPEIGTVTESGEWEIMTPDRFRTWLPAVGGVIPFGETRRTGEPVKCGVPYELARAVLASDELRTKTPEIERVNLVRLPVLRAALDARGEERRAGFRRVELLPIGYDVESKTYTVRQAVDYDENLDPVEGVRWLRDLVRHFAFSDENRMAVQLAAMLTVFCRGIYFGRPPMFLWNSNLAGSGKSRLAQMCLDPIYGEAGKSGWSFDRQEEIRKELDGAAQAFAPYIWFDDVPKGTIRSTDLNRWLTGKTWQCRIMGTKGIFKGPLHAVTFMTGAQLELDPMLARRTLIVDLFPKTKARNRHLPPGAIPINDRFFEDEAMRGKVLACLWSLVRNWDDMGRPAMSECPDLMAEAPLESFEGWSEVLPAMVSAASFGNCLAVFAAPDTGDTETREFEKLAEILITSHALGRDSVTVTMEDTVAAARMGGLFVDYLGSLEDVIRDLDGLKSWDWKFPDELAQAGTVEESERIEKEWKRKRAAGYTDKKIQSSWGKRFRRSAVSGQFFQVAGEVWEFGTRATSRKAAFPITRVTAGK